MPYADREDWLARRREGIGASDVAAILGLSPYSSPFSVWADKTHGAEKEQTDAMLFGKKLEGIIQTEFEETTGLYISSRELLVHHPVETWATATIDGLAWESPQHISQAHSPNGFDAVVANVEFKADGGFGRWEEVPDHYQIQVQWQMWVEGLDQTILACLHGGLRFEIYEVDADPIVQQKMVDKVSAWREKYLLDPESPPPEVDAHPATSRVIADLWSDPTEDEIELSPQMYADLEALRGLKVSQKDLGDQVKRLENRLKVALQEATTGSYAGRPVVTYKQRTVKEHVRREATFRVLSLLNQKEA